MKKLLIVLLFIVSSCQCQQVLNCEHHKGKNVNVVYGYLYNWYAAGGIGDTAIYSTGWTVPTKTQIETLQTYLGGSTQAAIKTIEIGVVYFTINGGSDNSAKFNARGSGYRSSLFYDYKSTSWIHTTTAYDATDYVFLSIQGSSLIFIVSGHGGKLIGAAVRLIKTTTSLTNGQAGTYTGNDGRIYRTICIGTQEWLADNLCETKYANGTLIPVVTGNAAWAALVTGARCAYDNTETNALIP